MFDLQPESPHDAGVEETVPDPSHIEGAELLANDARAILHKRGFTDDEINQWALTYIADTGSGDLGSFLGWVVAREQRR